MPRSDARPARVCPSEDVSPRRRGDAVPVLAVGGLLISDEYAADLREALDTLATLAAEKGARLPRRIARLRDELCQIGTRANARVSRRKVTTELKSAQAELGLVEVAEAAERLEIRADSVRDLCRRGKLAAMRPDGRWWISEASVNQRARAKGAQ